MLRTEIIRDIAEIQKMKEAWNQLLEKSASANVFVSWEWITQWWHQFGNGKELFVVIIRNAQEIVCIAPFMLVPVNLKALSVKTLTFIGQAWSPICPDHLNLIALPEYENALSEKVCEELLNTKGVFEKVQLSELSSHSLMMLALQKGLSSRERPFFSDKACVAPYVKLPTTKYSNWKYKSRKLQKKYEVRLENYTDPDQVEGAMATIKTMVVSSAERNNRSSSWDDARYCAFHTGVSHELAKREKTLISVLYCDGQPVAGLYGYLSKDAYLMYSTGFDANYSRDSVGQVHTGLFCEYLYANRLATEYDFLRGEEEYKYRWTDDKRENHCISFYCDNGKGKMLYMGELCYRQVLKIYRKVKSRCGYYLKGPM